MRRGVDADVSLLGRAVTEGLQTCTNNSCWPATGGLNPLCGGFNYPHGIMKKLSCMAKRAKSSGTLYVKGCGEPRGAEPRAIVADPCIPKMMHPPPSSLKQSFTFQSRSTCSWLTDSSTVRHGPPPPPAPPVPDYDALNVWPMPTTVTLCGQPRIP